MADIEQLGKELGYEGQELRQWVTGQQEIQRADRAAEGDAEKARAEAKKVRAEAEAKKVWVKAKAENARAEAEAEKVRVEAEIENENVRVEAEDKARVGAEARTAKIRPIKKQN